MRDGLHRTVKQLRTARFGGKVDPGFDGGFTVQHPGVGFKEANIIVRDGNFWPARGDSRRVQLLNLQIKGLCAAFHISQKFRTGRAKIDDARTFENALFSLFSQLVPQRLGTKHQRNIAFPLAIGMANETRVAVVATFAMGRQVRVNHQDIESCLCRVIPGGRSYGATANND